METASIYSDVDDDQLRLLKIHKLQDLLKIDQLRSAINRAFVNLTNRVGVDVNLAMLYATPCTWLTLTYPTIAALSHGPGLTSPLGCAAIHTRRTRFSLLPALASAKRAGSCKSCPRKAESSKTEPSAWYPSTTSFFLSLPPCDIALALGELYRRAAVVMQDKARLGRTVFSNCAGFIEVFEHDEQTFDQVSCFLVLAFPSSRVS